MKRVAVCAVLLFNVVCPAQEGVQPVTRLLRFWSQSAVYYPLSHCCEPASYGAGADATVLTREYSSEQYGICAEAWRAAFIFAVSREGNLSIDRDRRFPAQGPAGCAHQLGALERDHSGNQRKDARSHIDTIKMPALQDVFRAAPDPSSDQIEKLKLLLNDYPFTSPVTITVGKWVRERSQAHACVRFGSSEEILIVDPLTRNVQDLVWGPSSRLRSTPACAGQASDTVCLK